MIKQPTSVESLFIKLMKLLENYAAPWIATVGGLVLSVYLSVVGLPPEFWEETNRPKHIFMGALFIAALIATIITLYRAPAIKTLEEDNVNLRKENADRLKELEQYRHNHKESDKALIDEQLKILADISLGLGNDERVTLYRYREDKDKQGHFIPISRYSRNPDYCQLGRQRYPANQGVIGIAWREGEAQVCDLPHPVNASKRYNNKLRDTFGIDAAITAQLTMKSRNLAAFGIKDVRSDRRCAVIVFESIHPLKFKFDELKSLLDSGEVKRLAQLLKRWDEHAPESPIPGQEGF